MTRRKCKGSGGVWLSQPNKTLVDGPGGSDINHPGMVEDEEPTNISKVGDFG